MQRYRVHMINSEFSSAEDGNYASVEAALQSGLRAAVGVVCDQVARGDTNSAIEIRVEEKDQVVARRVIAFSVSDLATEE